MARKSGIVFEGVGDLAYRLWLLGENVGPAVNRALRGAARTVVDEAKANAPRRTGALARSQGLRIRRYESSRYTAVMGARRGFGGMMQVSRRGKPIRVNPANYHHLVEFGTAPGARRMEQSRSAAVRRRATTTARRFHPGTAPRPFLQDAFGRHAVSLLAGIREELGRLIRDASRRVGVAV
jgi:HK97 gp10 family phage protein